MILESYVQALLLLIKEGKLAVGDIKSAEYKEEVETRLAIHA
jgi:hypothetical protein